ncbi:MAG: DNA polymerase III subunit delta' [Pirellulales bacterium]
MAWQGIQGHDEVVEGFRRSLKHGRLASTFLFAGPEGVGKRTFAFKLAQTLLCQTQPAERLDPCGHCTGCVQVLARTHPDLLEVSRPKDRSMIPVELLIGSGERRMHEGLCHAISLKPFMGGRRIAIIDDADYLNEEGANCLLKTLEEPPPRSVMILIGTSAEKQLPTIRSRSQLIRFRPLDEETLAGLAVEEGLAGDIDQARRLARHAEGSLGRARELAEPALWSFRRQLLEQLSAPRLNSVALARSIAAFVDEAGKEAPARRARGRQLVRFALDYYRGLCTRASGVVEESDAELDRAIASGAQRSSLDGEAAAQCADRCLDALDHIDRNANQAAWLECWVDDLAQCSR